MSLPPRSVACLLLTIVLLISGALVWNQGIAQSTTPTHTHSQHSTQIDPAENGRMAFSHFTDRNGLPQNAIQAMAFDHKGYLWVGTQDGAAYYNGRIWTVVNMPNRTRSNFVRSLLVASDDSIWFGRQEGGVSQLKNGNWTAFDEKSGLPDKRVNALLETRAEDGQPILWIGTDKGLAQLKGDIVSHADSQGSFTTSRVTSFTETKDRDGSSVVWVGSEEGIERFYKRERTSIKGPDAKTNLHVSSLLASRIDEQDALWVGTNNGLNRYSIAANTWTTFTGPSGFPASNVVCIAETRELSGNQVLWAGTDGGGLVRYRAGLWTVFGASEGLLSNSVFSLLPSSGPGATEMLWIGTDGGGLARLPMGGWRSFTTANGLPANSIYCIFETTDAVGPAMWFGTYGAGLARLQNGSWTIFDKSKGMPDNTVFEMLETTLDDGKRVLWAGLKGGGLARLENGRWSQGDVEREFGESTVRNMLATFNDEGERVVWVASGNRGLGRLYKNKWTFFDTTNGLPHKSVFEMAETSENGKHVLWVATGGGGIARLAGGQWKVYDDSTGLPTNSVLSLHVTHTRSGKEYLWAGTEGGGLARMELNESTKETPHWEILSDTTTPALPNNTIYQIQEDANGAIYFSHNKGVTRLSPANGTTEHLTDYEAHTFTMDDGLPANEGNGGVSYVDSKGRVWFGTVGGAAVFDPAQQISDSATRPLYIEHTSVGGKSRTIDGQTLAHDENHLIFEYAMLSFAHEHETRYRTQLVGLENEPSAWTTDPKKDFTSLPPGHYTFKVWGKDYKGNVTEPASISFSIKPPLWGTWWAYVLYGSALVGFAFVGLRFRTKSLTRRNKWLSDRVDERTRELAEKVDQLKESEQRAYTYAQAKSQFLANMSHEIRTPINGVIGMTSLLLDTPLTPEQRERAELVKRSGNVLLTVINDILDFSKLEAGKLQLEMIDFELSVAIEDVLDLVARKAQSKKLELASFIEPSVPQTLRGDPIRLRQVLINLVHNAIKFTEHGEVSVRVSVIEEKDDKVVLRYEVSDTGIGVEKEILDNLFQAFTQADSSTTRKYGGTGLGLSIAKQLVELMDGEIGIESTPKVGSKFWFTTTFARALVKNEPLLGHSSFKGRQVLYVGTPGTQRESILTQLTQWQFQVVVVNDGASAQSALKASSDFAAVIIDAQLADMQGRELAQSFRNNTVPTVLLTLIAEQLERREGFHALSKPVRRAQLYSRLINAITGNTPAVTADDATQPAPADERSLTQAYRANNNYRLLLVEDNQTNQEVAAITLATMGYNADTVTNGHEALSALNAADYDLVFMDCHMPEMDGFEATAEIRRQENGRRRTPIIAMTASALPEDRARCLSVGMDDYLTKPIDRRELRAVLDRWLPANHEGNMMTSGAAAAGESSAVKVETLEKLRKLGGTNRRFLAELIDIFLQESVKRFSQLKEAAARNDVNTVRLLAHTQRGASINLGAERMAQLCEELETANASGAQAVSEMINGIEREFVKVNQALEAERLSLQNS